MNFNHDPEWASYVTRMEPLVQATAHKMSRGDRDLHEDIANIARISLYRIHPESLRHYEPYKTGLLSEEDWQRILLAFCRRVVRNQCLRHLIRHGEHNMSGRQGPAPRFYSLDRWPQIECVGTPKSMTNRKYWMADVTSSRAS